MKNQNQSLFVLLFLTLFYYPNDICAQISSVDSVIVSTENDTTKLRKIVVSYPGERIAGRAQYKIGSIAFSNKREDIAEREFLTIRNNYPDISEAKIAAYYLGVISLHKERHNAAKAFLSEYLASSDSGSRVEWAKYYQLKALFRDKDDSYESSARNYLSSRRSVTKEKEIFVRTELLRYLMDRGKLQEAFDEANVLIKLFPNDERSIDAQFKIGDILIVQGKQNNAEKHFQNILKGAPKNSEIAARAQYQLAGVFDSKGDYVSARREYFSAKQNSSLFPRWKKASEFALAMLTFKEWQRDHDSLFYENAKNQISNFIKNNPADRHIPRALMAIADMACANGEYENAINAYDRILLFDASLIPLKPNATIRSNDVKTFNEMLKQIHLAKAALLHLQLHKTNDAIAQYDEVLKNNPDCGEALLNKALCLIDLEKRSEAKVILRQLTQRGKAESALAIQMLKTIVD